MLCLYSIIIKSQNFDFYKYRNDLNKATYEFEYKKNYSEALKNYQEAFKYGNKNIPNSNDYINIAICYLNIKDTIKAIESLKQSVLSEINPRIKVATIGCEKKKSKMPIIHCPPLFLAVSTLPWSPALVMYKKPT